MRKLSGQGHPCFVMAPNGEFAHEENRRAVATYCPATAQAGWRNIPIPSEREVFTDEMGLPVVMTALTHQLN